MPLAEVLVRAGYECWYQDYSFYNSVGYDTSHRKIFTHDAPPIHVSSSIDMDTHCVQMDRFSGSGLAGDGNLESCTNIVVWDIPSSTLVNHVIVLYNTEQLSEFGYPLVFVDKRACHLYEGSDHPEDGSVIYACDQATGSKLYVVPPETYKGNTPLICEVTPFVSRYHLHSRRRICSPEQSIYISNTSKSSDCRALCDAKPRCNYYQVNNDLDCSLIEHCFVEIHGQDSSARTFIKGIHQILSKYSILIFTFLRTKNTNQN